MLDWLFTPISIKLLSYVVRVKCEVKFIGKENWICESVIKGQSISSMVYSLFDNGNNGWKHIFDKSMYFNTNSENVLPERTE